MKDNHRTEYRDDALNVENGTQPEEIQEFVRRRIKEPVRIEGLVVWNFNNHRLNRSQLEEQADDLLYDEYVIPYQASGVWGYMVTLLPERVREAEILTYKQRTGEYNPYPNYIRHSDDGVNNGLRDNLEEIAEEVSV